MNNATHAFTNEIFVSKNLTPTVNDTSDLSLTVRNIELKSCHTAPNSVQKYRFLAKYGSKKDDFELPGGIIHKYGREKYLHTYIIFILAVVERHGIFRCTGTLISENWILCAAECLSHDGIVPKFLLVVATKHGRLNDYIIKRLSKPIEKDVKTRDVEERRIDFFRVHPLFDKRRIFHNVALLKLNEPFSFFIPVANLSLEKLSRRKSNCMVIGYGLCKGWDGDYDLRVETVPNLTVSTPQIGCRYGGKKGPLICFVLDRTKFCPGDSGVPLLCEGKIYAINTKDNFTAELIHVSGCDKGDEIYYTSLHEDVNWIGAVINKGGVSVGVRKKLLMIFLACLIFS